MNRQRWARHFAVACVLVSLTIGFGTMPGGVAAAGAHPSRLHSAAVQMDGNGQALSAGVAHALRRLRAGDSGRAPEAMSAYTPDWTQQARLSAADGQRLDLFGFSVALSGNSVLVGAPERQGYVGAAYVFVRSGSNWTQQAELTASDGGPGDNFGASVALSGTTAVIGAYHAHSGTGAAYVFVRSGTTWKPQAELTAFDGAAGDWFGRSVALGNGVVIAGSPYSHGTGRAYVFVQGATRWSQQAELAASDAASGDLFGASVAISSLTAMAGAYNKNNGAGAAYVFVRSGATWRQQAELMSSDDVSGDNFGSSVAVDGATAVVGAAGKSTYTGAAYVFVRSGSAWSQQAKLIASNARQLDSFGFSVAVSGATILVGADNGNSGSGAAYVFARSGTTWSQQTEFIDPAGGHADYFGGSVALNSTTAVVGADYTNGGPGAAYVYVRHHA